MADQGQLQHAVGVHAQLLVARANAAALLEPAGTLLDNRALAVGLAAHPSGTAEAFCQLRPPPGWLGRMLHRHTRVPSRSTLAVELDLPGLHKASWLPAVREPSVPVADPRRMERKFPSPLGQAMTIEWRRSQLAAQNAVHPFAKEDRGQSTAHGMCDARRDLDSRLSLRRHQVAGREAPFFAREDDPPVQSSAAFGPAA
jgi:hypothetical protein